MSERCLVEGVVKGWVEAAGRGESGEAEAGGPKQRGEADGSRDVQGGGAIPRHFSARRGRVVGGARTDRKSAKTRMFPKSIDIFLLASGYWTFTATRPVSSAACDGEAMQRSDG